MDPYIEVAHEALIQKWQRLDEWLDEDREYLLWRQSLRPFVTLWKAHKSDPDTLLRGTLLQTASDWESQRSADLGVDEKAYIAESRNQETLRERQKTRRWRWNVSGFAAVTIVLIVCGAIVWMASRSNKKTITASGYLVQASLHEQRGNYPGAIEDYTKALKLSRDLPSAYLGRARVYNLQGGELNYRNAIADYNEFINLIRDSMPPHELAVAYDGRGQAYFRVNELDNARKDFTTAIELDQHFALALYDLGSLLAHEAYFDKAIERYTQSINSDPGFYSAYLGRGKALFARDKTSNREEDLQNALKDFEHAQSLNGDATEPYLRVGLVHYERNEFRKAIDQYEQALKRDNHYAEASNALGQAYVQTGQLEKAISYFKDAAGRGYIRAEYNLGLAYKNKGDYENAINSLEMFIHNSPDDSEALLSLGEAYALKGNHEAAIRNYSRSIDLKPEQSDAYFRRGESYVKTDVNEKAISDFLSFLKLPTTESRLYQARQYLEQLNFMPPIDSVQIHLHYNKTIDEALLDKIKTALKDKRFNRIKPIQAESDLASIRFFQNPFRTYAQNIRDTVKGVYESNSTPQNFPYNKFPDPKNKDAYGWIEIWLPASRPTVSTPTILKP